MKKILLLTLAILPLAVGGATVPGSTFPITNNPPNWATFLMVDTNGNGSTDPNTRSNLQFTWSSMKSDLQALINPNFPWLIITNGSPDFVIQAAFNSLTNGGVVSFQPGTYPIMTTNLFITNSLFVFGDGVTLTATNNLVGYLMTTGTNYHKTLVIDNISLDGGIIENYNQTNYSFMFNGSLDPYYTAGWTNHGGLYIECSGGVRVQNSTFANWSGSAVHAIQVGGTLQAQNAPKFEFLFNRCYTNYIGLFVPGAQWEVPGYNNAPNGSWLDATAEYGLIEGNDIFNNQRGIIAGAGNLLVQGNTINGNWHGIDIFTGNNPGHGRYCGNTLNHNYFAGYLEQTSGGLWQDNVMLANTVFVFNGAHDTSFIRNSLGQTGLIATNGCTLTIAENVYQHGAAWGVNNPTTGIATNLEAAVLVYGNMDTVGTNNDGTTIGGSAVHNGLMTPSNMPPISADYSGQMFFWNSNGVSLFLLKSSAASTAWSTTNLIN